MNIARRTALQSETKRWRVPRLMHAVICLALALAGCDQNLTMADQQKYHEWERGPAFRNGQVVQVPVAGTIGRGQLARDERLALAPAVTPALLERGRQRYDIYCSPCHSRVGDGRGVIVGRGMPMPPSFHQERLRAAPDRHFVDVITKGWGAMYAYNDRVAPEDRWAITAYIRALQLSQNATLEDLPAEARARLGRAP
jgi:mono/diheme cytochrome c family protein